jgi:hypothetical protein
MHTDSKSLVETFKNMKLKKVVPLHFLLLEKGEQKRIKDELKPLGKKIFFPSDFSSLTL